MGYVSTRRQGLTEIDNDIMSGTQFRICIEKWLREQRDNKTILGNSNERLSGITLHIPFPLPSEIPNRT